MRAPWLASTVLLTTVTLLCSCGSTSQNQPRNPGPAGASPAAAPAPTSDEANADVVSDFLTHHRHHHHGGFLMLVTMSLDTLGLAPEERARVEDLRSDLLSKMQPARIAERNLVDVLATGVAESFLDKKKVDAALVGLANAAAASHDAAVDDLNRLHALLTPPERAALMEKAESHWRLWQQANAATGSESPVEALNREVGLTPLQMAQVRRDFAAKAAQAPLRSNEVEQHVRAFDRAFRSEHFDARDLLEASSTNRHMAEWGASRLALYCEVVDPVLTPEQRNMLVSILREHLDHDESQAGG